MNSSDFGKWTVEQPGRLYLDGPVRTLKLNVAQGRVNVIGTDGPASIEVTRITQKPLQVTLSDGDLKVVHGDENLSTVVDWLVSGHRQEIELSLALPPDTVVNLNVISGAVVVSNLHESTTVRGVSGDITLAGVHGSAKVNTVSGTITAEQVTGDIKVSAVSGPITVIAGPGGRIDLNTVSGALTLDLPDAVPDEVKLQCVSGDMTIRLPYAPDVNVELSTAHGRVASAFPEISEKGWHLSRQLSGRIGAGSARLRGNTISGAVTLLRRAEDELDAEFAEEFVEDFTGGFSGASSGEPLPPDAVQDQAPATDQKDEESR
jgi:Putative adhesin